MPLRFGEEIQAMLWGGIMEKRRIYLACPYSHDDPAVRQQRFEIANRVAAKLMIDGHLVFSPVSHSHPIVIAHDLPTDFAFWRDFDLSFLRLWATHLYVIAMDGMAESTGVRAELSEAASLILMVAFVTEQGDQITNGDDILRIVS